MTLRIRLKSIADIDELLKITSLCEISPIAKQGSREVDCSSVMGLYTLDLGQPFELIYNAEYDDRIRGHLSDFIV